MEIRLKIIGARIGVDGLCGKRSGNQSVSGRFSSFENDSQTATAAVRHHVRHHAGFARRNGAVDRREANRREPTAIVSVRKRGRLMAERQKKGTDTGRRSLGSDD